MRGDDVRQPRRSIDRGSDGRGQQLRREDNNWEHDHRNGQPADRRQGAYAREPSSSNSAAQRSYYPPEMFERDPVHRPPYGSGPGRSNYGASKYGGSEYAEVDYDRTPAERNSDGGPYSLQSDDEVDGESYRQAMDSWLPEDENDNRVDYDPGSWVKDRAAPTGRQQEFGSTDEHLRRLVCERLSDAPALDDREIYVEVDHGEVTLTGYVRTRAEKYLAEEVVESVGGLAGINDRLQVVGEESSTHRNR